MCHRKQKERRQNLKYVLHNKCKKSYIHTHDIESVPVVKNHNVNAQQTLIVLN